MSVSGWITCHCGQNIPGGIAAPGRHVRPGGTVPCIGIDVRLHVPGLCWECREGTHTPEFVRTLDVIRWETSGSVSA